MSAPESPEEEMKPEDSFQGIAELNAQLEELKADIDFLKVENILFARYYEKKKSEMVNIDDDEKKKKGNKSKKNLPSLLTSEQKYEISCAINEVWTLLP